MEGNNLQPKMLKNGDEPRNDGGNIINKPSWKYVSASFSGLVFRDSHPGVEYGCLQNVEIFRRSHSLSA